ncbi:MAG: FAD-dependent monooxygenase [Gemmatimonadales bacterium]|nr:FAD-dependent monooxygenase [Gemmatimonadales bacterium]
MVDFSKEGWARNRTALDNVALRIHGSAAPGRVAVIGAGLAGLNIGRRLAQAGATVTVFERRPDPRKTPLHDTRSFNITLGEFGLAAAGDVESAIRDAGQRVVGRAVFLGGKLTLSDYGLRSTDGFVSIPRPTLLEQLRDAAERAGVTLYYDREVVSSYPDSGVVESRRPGDGTLERQTFGLIIYADGVTGEGRQVLLHRPEVSSHKVCDPIQYLRVRIDAREALAAGLPLSRVNFWTGPGGVSIGIPNRDGSFSVLIMGQFGGAFGEPPFTSKSAAAEFLRRRNRSLLEIAPNVAEQLVNAPRGGFCYTTTSHWQVGRLAMLIGDSARCTPPWAGVGGAAALDDGTTFVGILAEHQRFDRALAAFEANRLVAARILGRMVSSHANLLMREIGSVGWRVAEVLARAKERAFGTRTVYQRIVFERDGLARLVAADSARQPAAPRWSDSAVIQAE